MKDVSNLRPYQQRGVDHMLDVERGFLGFEPGLGKTVTTLTWITELQDRMLFAGALVVAPPQIAISVWAQEAKQWAHTRGLSFRLLHGPGWTEDVAKPADIYLLSYNALAEYLHIVKALGIQPANVLVLDESTHIKNVSSKRFKALRYKLGAYQYRIALSGTPTPNGLLDIWTTAFIIDEGERLGTSIVKYRALHFSPGWSGYTWELRQGHQKKITDKLKDVFVTLKAKDYVSLPPLTHIDIPVSMPGTAWVEYKRLQKTGVQQLKGAEDTALTASVLMQKLQQIASGFLYEDRDRGRTVRSLHDAKIKALSDLMDGLGEEQLLIIYKFHEDRSRITKMLHARGIRVVPTLAPGVSSRDRNAFINLWNAKQAQVLLTPPLEGLNLQDGGARICWYGHDYRSSARTQTNARLHRPGQTRPVISYRLVTEGTVDELILDKVNDKLRLQDLVINALHMRNPGSH